MTKANHIPAKLRLVFMGLVIFSAFIMGVSLISGPAWAFETTTYEENSPSDNQSAVNPLISKDPAEPAHDSCASLLTSVVHHSDPSAAMDQMRSPSQKAATVGLVLGVRFALGPRETYNSKARRKNVRLDLWRPQKHGSFNNRKALAVSAYRSCKKKAALKALEEWRWKR